MVVFHTPVLLKEVVEFLKVRKGEKYIDATVGGGGHTEAILKAGGEVLGIDCDPEAVAFSRKHLALACPVPTERERPSGPPDVFRWKIVQGNFADLKEIAQENGFVSVAGILFDLGVSSYQLKTAERGFSFQADMPLDMRMNPDLKVTAADLINGLTKGELYELFTKYSEEKLAWPIAAAVARARAVRPVDRCDQLARIVEAVYKKHYRARSRIHPATKVFQALRIAVNDELNSLKEVLPQAVELLQPGGRLTVISFHGLEDGIVKRFFKEKEKEGILKILTKKPARPTDKEIEENPRARSGKLRAGEKI